MNEYKSIQDIINSLVEDIKSRVPVSSGALKNSIKGEIEGNSISISMLYYGEFQDKGVNGTETSWGSPYSYRDKKPPALAFKSQSLSAGFAIATSIYRKGIKPKNFIQPALDNFNESLLDPLVEEIWDNFKKEIE